MRFLVAVALMGLSGCGPMTERDRVVKWHELQRELSDLNQWWKENCPKRGKDLAMDLIGDPGCNIDLAPPAKK